MPKRLRFGILGTGNIAAQFAQGLASSTRCTAASVGSRSAASATAFASHHHIPAAHSSYEAVLADPDVDAVYISLPNAMHHPWTLEALAAGKHVLCEKPLAVTAPQAEEMFDAAGRHGRILVEAFMYRSHPMMKQVVSHVRRGTIGRLKLLRTSFCYRTTNIQENIRFSTLLAGGAIMDIGCYCVDLAGLLADAPVTHIHAAAHIHPTGVDDYAAGVLRFDNDIVCDFACGMTVQANNLALVCGDDGYIQIPIPWKPPQTGARYTICRQTPPRQDAPQRTGAAHTRAAQPPPPEEHRVDADRSLFAFEADDFADVVLDSASPAIDRAASLRNARILDELRKQAGLDY